MRNAAFEQGNIAEIWKNSRTQDWPEFRIKMTLQSVVGGVWGTEPDDDTAIVCVRVADFDRTRLRVQDNPPTKRCFSESDLNGRLLAANDLLIEKSGGGSNQPVGCVVRFDGSYDAVCSNFIAKLELKSDHDARFWTYLHAAIYSARLNTLAIKQTTGIQNLDLDQYLGFRVLVPPLEQQRSIAGYLDRETATIDEMIAAKQRLLTLLAEKRRALVTRAVSRGLNPNASTRDSGVEWLGKIPEHWKLYRLKMLVSGIEQGWSPQCFNYPADADSWGVVKAGCCNGGIFDADDNKMLPPDIDPPTNLEIHPGDVLMSRASGSRELIGSVAVVPAGIRSKLLLSDKTYRLTLRDDLIDSEFFALTMGSHVGRYQITAVISGAEGLANNVGQGDIKEFAIPLPPLEEQRSTVTAIQRKIQASTFLEESTRTTLALLTERRKAVISSVVTGVEEVP